MVKKYPKLAVKNIFPSKYEIQGACFSSNHLTERSLENLKVSELLQFWDAFYRKHRFLPAFSFSILHIYSHYQMEF